ncbi:MAG TPA: hypothetical protein DIW31_01480, partial [Bacteroidales bacterium]|nr:hypothetical protein [Bacteroidales bacterium]
GLGVGEGLHHVVARGAGAEAHRLQGQAQPVDVLDGGLELRPVEPVVHPLDDVVFFDLGKNRVIYYYKYYKNRCYNFCN